MQTSLVPCEAYAQMEGEGADKGTRRALAFSQLLHPLKERLAPTLARNLPQRPSRPPFQLECPGRGPVTARFRTPFSGQPYPDRPGSSL